MKINWKARFKNKTFVLALVALVVAFVYQVLGLFGIIPPISEDAIVNTITMFVNILAFIGVVVDPTTDGVNDSDRAMTYYTEDDEREAEK